MKKPIDVAQRVFKQFFLYFYTDLFGNYFMQKREERKDIKTQSDLESYIQKCKAEIAALIKLKNVPVHWYQTFYNAVVNGKMDLPLHEGISLSVGEYQINNGQFDEEKVKNSGASSVSIKVTSKASATQIRQFIKDNSELIVRLENILNLPVVEYPRLDNFAEGVNIQIMKDFKKLSDEQITDELQKEQKGDVYLDTVKKTAKRYQKYLKQKS